MGRPLNFSHRFLGPHRFWHRRRILSLSGHFYGRRKNCFRIARAAVVRSYIHSVRHRRVRRMQTMQTFDARLSAACRELGSTRSQLNEALQELNISMNYRMLQNLAIWEPRSFRALTLLSRKLYADRGLNNIEPPPKGVITRGML